VGLVELGDDPGDLGCAGDVAIEEDHPGRFAMPEVTTSQEA
jgi:hypothetical protein